MSFSRSPFALREWVWLYPPQGWLAPGAARFHAYPVRREDDHSVPGSGSGAAPVPRLVRLDLSPEHPGRGPTVGAYFHAATSGPVFPGQQTARGASRQAGDTGVASFHWLPSSPPVVCSAHPARPAAQQAAALWISIDAALVSSTA